MENQTTKRSFYHKKRTWIAALITTPFAIEGFMALNGHWQLQDKLDALREAGMPTSGEELNDFYKVPDGTTDSTEAWLKAISLASEGTFQEDCKLQPILGQADTPVVGEDWKGLAKARDFLAAHQDQMDAIRAAAEQGGAVRFPVDFRIGVGALLTNTQDVRTLARLLILDAHVSQRDEKPEQAIQDIIHTFALSDALQCEPCLVSQLVRFAIYAIGCDNIQKFMPVCDWNDSQLAKLQDAVALLDARQAYSVAMAGERAICLTTADQNALLPGMAQSNKKEFLRLFAASEQAMESSWCEAMKQQFNIAVQFHESASPIDKFRYTLVYLMFPATESATKAGARTTARQLCAVAALAAERFRLARGELPDSLASIPAEFLPPSFADNNWIDPFSDQPLKYLKDETGMTVYSIGDDQSDDGGDVLYSEDHSATDVGTRIPLSR